MIPYSGEYKFLLVLSAIEALSLLALAVFCLTRLGSGVWAALVGLGATAAGLVGLFFAVANGQYTFQHDDAILQLLVDHRHLNTVLSTIGYLGTIVLVVGVVVSRSGSSAPASSGPTGSPYGR